MIEVFPFKASYKIRANEVGANANLSFYHLCNYMQDAADQHATELGFAVDQLPPQLIWIMVGMRTQLTQAPAWKETITLETVPTQFEKFYAYRTFIFWHNEKPIGQALTRWILMDRMKNRPIDLKSFFAEFNLPQNNTSLVFSKRFSLSSVDYSHEFQVRVMDIDMLHHTNNAVYVGWLLDAKPPHVEGKLTDVEILFKNESVLSDRVQVKSSVIKENSVRHTAFRKDDAKVIFEAQTHWS